MHPQSHRYVRHDLLELASSFADYSVVVTTAQLEQPGPQIIYVNSAFTRMTGYSISDMLGKTPRILQGPDTDYGTLSRLRTTLEAGNDFIARTVNYRRDGSPFELEWIISHLKDSNGTTTHYIALQRDITDKNRAESELSRFDDELRNASKQLSEKISRLETAERQLLERERMSALGEITAGVVHDISNALAPVFTLVQALHSLDNLPVQVETYVTSLERSTTHAIQVLDNLKQLYRSGGANRFTEPLSLRQIIEQVPDLTKGKWYGLKHQASAGISFSLDLRAAGDVLGNETELLQVFINLVNNAVDAMPDGGTITVKLIEEHNHAVVVVSDSGVGMSAKGLAECFTPYVSTKDGSTGLGLSVCRRLVEEHGGTISVELNEPCGAKFTIQLPLSGSEHAPMPTDPNVAKPLRVLHIDSNNQRAKSICSTLTAMGHQVDIATSGDEGLKRFFDDPYDVIIASNSLSPTSGYDIAQAIKRRSPQIPVALLFDADEAIESDNLPPFTHPDAVLRTPVDGRTLEDILNSVRHLCCGAF